MVVPAADEARGSLEAKVQEHIAKAKHAAVKEALRRTEDELHKLIAVPAVELLQSFPANLWQQLHTVRSQVRETGRKARVHVKSGQGMCLVAQSTVGATWAVVLECSLRHGAHLSWWARRASTSSDPYLPGPAAASLAVTLCCSHVQACALVLLSMFAAA